MSVGRGVLKIKTQRLLEQNLSREALTIVSGWAASNPKQVQAWEADGSLLAIAKVAGDKAADVLAWAKRDGMNHLANHEIYELYGGPNLKL